MKLIKLYSNKKSFRTVRFNEKGLSIILAKKKENTQGGKKTYNGTGKSLIIALIHFCLGSNPNSAFEKSLKIHQTCTKMARNIENM